MENAFKRSAYVMALFIGLAYSTSAPAQAETVGVSMRTFDDYYQSVLRSAMSDHAAEIGLDIQIEDAQLDPAKQINQIENFIASGVDAIIVSLADPGVGWVISDAAASAGVPLVYLGVEPPNASDMPEMQAYIGNSAATMGMLQGLAACHAMAQSDEFDPKLLLLSGESSYYYAQVLTNAAIGVTNISTCDDLDVVTMSTDWTYQEGYEATLDAIQGMESYDAVIANSDTLALAAITAMQDMGYNLDDVLVVGVGGSSDALSSIAADEMDMSISPDLPSEARLALDVVIAMRNGESLPPIQIVPPIILTSGEGTADLDLMSRLLQFCPDCAGQTTYCSTTCPSECNGTCQRCGADNAGYGCTKTGIVLP